MSGLPAFSGSGQAAPIGVAGYIASPLETAAYLTSSPKTAGRSPPAPSSSSFLHTATSLGRRMKSKRLNGLVRRMSRNLGRCMRMITMPCYPSPPTDSANASNTDIPKSLRPGMRQSRRRKGRPESLLFEPQDNDSLELPRVSPTVLGIPLAERGQWLRDNPKRTTIYDDDVMAMPDYVPPETITQVPPEHAMPPPPVPLNANVTAKQAVQPTVPDKSSKIAYPDLSKPIHFQSKYNPLISGRVPIHHTQTFESILGHNSSASGSTGSVNAIGLNASTNESTSSTINRKPVPAGGPYKAYSEDVAKQTASAGKHTPPGPSRMSTVTTVTTDVEIPDFEAVARSHDEELERKKGNRLSCRAELHLEQEPRKRNFDLLSQNRLAVPGIQPSYTEGSDELFEKGKKRQKRISMGFLQPGPDLEEVAEEIVERVLHTPRQKRFATTRAFEIDRGTEETKVSTSQSNAGSSRFPILRTVTQSLGGSSTTLLSPIGVSDSPSPTDEGAIGDFDGPRWSDQDYVDPAVEDFRQNRKKRVAKRKRDIERFERETARGDASDTMMQTAGPSLVGELISFASLDSVVGSCEGVFGGHASVGEGHSALLRDIDFTGDSRRPSLARGSAGNERELIEF
jgi:hypothetical protein